MRRATGDCDMNSLDFECLRQRVLLFLVATAMVWPSVVEANPPLELRRWLQSPQQWTRDTDGPIVSLGAKGEFWQPNGIEPLARESNADDSLSADIEMCREWQSKTRSELQAMLGIPNERVPLEAEKRGEVEWDDVIIEKWVFTTEPGSRVPAVLYRPKAPAKEPMPAIVHTFGHGGSKSQWQYNYAGQLYARLGVACLSLDPLGEEERHHEGRLGTRAHDPKPISDRADASGRLVMGKLVLDTMRGIDFLLEREDIDPQRVGVAGNSLGGAKAGWMAALEPRIHMAIVSGWAYENIGLRTNHSSGFTIILERPQ